MKLITHSGSIETVCRTLISKIQWPLLLIFLFSSSALTAQNYTTTGLSTNWNDPEAWDCSAGPCNNNPVPNRNLSNTTVTIDHSITYDANQPINLGDKATINISRNAALNITSNLNIESGGNLIIENGEINIGPGVLNNLGMIDLTNAIFTKDGNVVNDTEIILSNSCFILYSGNFINEGTIDGDGNVKVESGNIDNSGTWGDEIDYYAANNSNVVTGNELSEEDINEKCDCILTNCDIVPGITSGNKFEGIIGFELNTLFLEHLDGENPNPAIYFINELDEVLIEIIVAEDNYSAVVSFLNSVGVTSANYIDDYFNPEMDENMITVFYPIARLGDLNDQFLIVREVKAVSPPIRNTGLIDSQGDIAQKSILARLGWDLSGQGIKVGVLSDSFDRKFGVVAGNSANVTTDINNQDLPGGSDAVNVIADYPFGVATDEGRAMLQIIHDVAPKAELYFRTGFISEGNMAAGIADLVNAGCHVIVDDISYLDSPMFRDGILANAVNSATAMGATYITTAGNFSDNSFEATFTADNNGVRHNFGQGPLQPVTLGVGQYIIVLQWEDDFYSLGSNSGAANDLDIYLADDLGNITDGFNIDNIGKDPVEVMHFTVINPTSTNIIIERIGGSNMPLRFKYVVFRAGDDGEFDAVPAASSSTIVGHANAEGAITVGAVRYDNTPAYGGTLLAQNSSSLGGLEINGVVRDKPNIMAPTGGDTSVDLGAPDFDNNNLPNFFGTSASAPHAAGIAALLLEAKTKFGVDPLNQDPDLSVKVLLQKHAIDMNDLKFDYKTGHGFVSTTASVGSFSNPTPDFINYSLKNLDTIQYQPGDIEFELVVEGQYFLDGSSKVFLRDVELATTFVNDSTLTATIPVFNGNPTIKVYTEPNALTNGTDGGDSNTLTFFDPIIVDVTVEAQAVTRRYGEANPEFEFFTKIGETEDPLPQSALDLLTPSVSLNTLATATSIVGVYSINVELSNINPDLLELYNFIIEPGVLNIDPMPVTIQPNAFDPITFGDPLPEITFQYIFGEENEQNVQVDPTVLANLQLNHQTALATFNGISLVNGLSLVNGISLVNGEPTINGISLVNTTFFVSQSTIDQSLTIAQNGLSLVNGDDNGKLVEFGADLFNTTSIANGTYSTFTNGISFVNGLNMVNGEAKLNNEMFNNGLNLVNGISFVNGINLVNGISHVNGISFVNGGGTITNSVSEPLRDAFNKVYVILSELDELQDPPLPVNTFPCNVITGKNVGTQYVIPGGMFDSNFILCYKPTPLEIEAADVTVQVDDKTITYGEPNPQYTVTVTGLRGNDTVESVFSEDFIYTPADGCTNSSIIEIVNTDQVVSDYEVVYLPGTLTINPVDLTVTITEDVFINEGQSLPNNIGYTVEGLICDDSLPQFNGYLVNGSPVTTNLAAGQYEITVDPDSVTGYDNYNIVSVAGTLIVNPLVGCNERIKASDLCKLPYSDPDQPQLITLLRFEYTNVLDIPIYIPNGPNNILKGKANFIGNPPELFLPGTHTFDIYTDSGDLQWEVITLKCKKPSKSPNGSNADPCSVNTSVSSLRLEEAPEVSDFKVYPNPVDNTITLIFINVQEPQKVRLYNNIGALLLEKNLNNGFNEKLELDVTSITSGIIFLELVTEKKVFYKRVIKK